MTAPLGRSLIRPQITPTARPRGGGPAPTSIPIDATITETLRPMPQATPTGIMPLAGFGPGENLIGTQINPVTGERLSGTQALVNRAAAGLSDLPSRSDLALNLLRNFQEELGEARQLGIQDIGRAAATFGQLGSGQVRTRLGELGERLNVQRNRFLRDLLTRTAGEEAGDALARLQALQDLEAQQFGQAARGREELRGERGFQVGEEQRALQDRIQQLLLERQVLGEERGFGLDMLQLLGQLGFISPDFAAQLGAADIFGRQAGAAGEALGQAGEVGVLGGRTPPVAAGLPPEILNPPIQPVAEEKRIAPGTRLGTTRLV